MTDRIARRLGIGARVVPMSEDAVRTRLSTDEGWLDFQEYFVHRQCRPAVRAIEYAGAATARAQPEALAALTRADLRVVVICPSNPFLSVEPILALPELRAALAAAAAPVIAVTPIVGGRAVKGPAAKMLRELGFEASSAAVARRYADFVDAFVSDASDPMPESVPGVQLLRAPTLMTGIGEREQLARTVLELAERLPRTPRS